MVKTFKADLSRRSEPIIPVKITLFDATVVVTTAIFPLVYLVLSIVLRRRSKTIIPPIILFFYSYILLGWAYILVGDEHYADMYPTQPILPKFTEARASKIAAVVSS